MKKEVENLQGINGWLILPIVHMIFFIGLVLYDLLVNVPQVPSNLMSIVILIDILLLALFILTLTLGFMKKRIAKLFFIISYAVNMIISFVIASLTNQYDTVSQPIVAGIIWIWYFSVSVRVKNTFIK